MSKIEPTIYKSKVWKLLEKQSKSLPKFMVTPVDKNNKEDKKKANIMEKLIEYNWKNDVDGFKTKYLLLQEKLAKMYVNESLYGIEVRWKDIEKTINSLVNPHDR